MSEKDGGAAFPFLETVTDRSGIPPTVHQHQHGGMSLRDYFAGQMLMGVFAGGRQIDIAHEVAKQQRAFEMGLSERQVAMETNKLIATMSYEMADAMLAERAK